MSTNNQVENRFFYKLTLCKGNFTPVYIIKANSISYTKRYRDYDALQFVVEREIYSHNLGEQIINPVWEYLEAGEIVLMEQYSNTDNINNLLFSEYFVIQDAKINSGETNLEKTVELIPYHQNKFNKTILNGYNDTRKLFDFRYIVDDTGKITIAKDSQGYPIPISYDMEDSAVGGILNIILKINGFMK